MSNAPSFMIVAGEISGDIHAASLVTAIRKKRPDASFFGIGGENMRAAGVVTVHDTRDMAVMGFAEIIHKLPFFRRVLKEMVEMAASRRPSAVILVDYPGFNLRFAERVHKMGIKTIYYICPQVWAWHRSRMAQMARNVDRLISIIPFEPDYFRNTGLDVVYAGSPLVDEAKKAVATGSSADIPWKGAPQIALLPGSRIHVIRRILPTMWQAARVLQNEFPDASFVIPAPVTDIASVVDDTIKNSAEGPAKWTVVTGNTRHVLRQADAAMVASGTATIEASLMECPMAIVYKMAPLSYLLGKMLVKVDHIGMVNLVAGKRLCPEFIQDDATPEALAAAVANIIRDEKTRSEMVAGLKEVNRRLGPGGAADRAADAVLSLM